MGDIYEISVKIMSISLEVRFSCSVYLQHNGKKITNEVRVSKGLFNINQTVQIRINPNNIAGKWDAYAVLATDRGSKYNCATISIPHRQLIQMAPMRPKTFALTKCSDKNAQITLEIVQNAQRNISLSINQVDYGSFSDPFPIQKLKLNSASQSREREGVAMSTGRFNDQLISFKGNNTIAEEMQLTHLKQKVEDLHKLIIQKNSRISNLQRQLNETKNKQQRVSYTQKAFKQELQQRDSIIQAISEQKRRLQDDLQSLKRSFQERQIEIEQQAENQIKDWNRLRMENQQNFLEELEILQSRNKELEQDLKLNSQQNRILSAQMDEIQKAFEQKYQKQAKKVKQLLQTMKIQEQVIEKLKKMEFINMSLSQQKQSLVIKNTEMKKELQNMLNLKRNNHLLQQQLAMMKKNMQKNGKTKEIFLEKLTQQYKIESQNINQQKQQLKDQLIKQLQKNKHLQQRNDELEIIFQKFQFEKKNLSQQNINFKKNLSSTELSAANLKEQLTKSLSINKILAQNNEKLTQTLEKQQKLTKQLSQKNEQLMIRQKQLSEELDDIKFKNEKFKLQLELTSNENDNTHLTCRQLQKKLQQKIKMLQNKLTDQQNQLIECKSQSRQGQRLLHQMRLQQSKNRQSVSNMTQKLGIVQKKLVKSETQVKDKQKTVNQLMQDRQRGMQMTKQYERRLLEATQNYHNILEQKHKIENEEYQSRAKVKDMEIQMDSKIRRIEELEEIQMNLGHKMKKMEESNLIMQNQIKAVNREIERIKQKNTKLVEKVVEIQQNADPVQTLINYHRSMMTKVEGQINGFCFELNKIKSELQEKNKRIQILCEQNTFLEELSQKNKNQIEYLQEINESKQTQLESVHNDHNQLLGIHEQYIFSFNRYKLEKQNEISKLMSNQTDMNNRISLMEQQKQQLETNLEEKTKESLQLKERQIELEGALKNGTHHIQKLRKENQENQTALTSEKIKNNKLNAELRMKDQQINELEVQNNFLDGKLERITQQFVQHKQMFMEMVKSKQRILKQELQKGQALINLQTQIANLRIMNENLQNDKENNQREIKELKQKNKNLIKENKSLQTTIALSEQSIAKNQIKMDERNTKIKELQNQINQQYEEIQTLKAKQKSNKRQNQEKLEKIQKQAQSERDKKQNLDMNLRERISQLEEKNSQLTKQRISLQNQIDKLTLKITTMQSQCSLSKAQTQALRNELNDLKKNYRAMMDEIKQKQQSLYAISGKMHEMQLKYEDEDRKTKMSMDRMDGVWRQKYESLRQQYDIIVTENERNRYNQDFRINSLTEQLKIKQQNIQRLKYEIEQLEFSMGSKGKIHEQQIEHLSKNYKNKIEHLQLSIRQKQQELKISKQNAQFAQLANSQAKSQLKILQEQLNTLKEKLSETIEQKQQLQMRLMEKQQQSRNRKQSEDDRNWQIHREIKKQFYNVCKDLEESITKEKYIETTHYLEEKVMGIVNKKP